MSTGFKKYLVANWVPLLNEIDTVNGLEGSMKSENVLYPFTIKKIWGTADQTARINLILEHIQRGDERRFKLFCKALASSGQEHIVRKYLTDCEGDSTDATPVKDSTNATAVQYPHAEPLDPRIKACLCKNWNEIIEMLSSNDLEFMNLLDKHDIFTKLKIRKLKDISEEFTRTEQILRWLETSSASTYGKFCHILCETKQGHLVSLFDESFLQTTCNPNRSETIVVSSSSPTTVVPISVQQIAHYPEKEKKPVPETVGACDHSTVDVDHPQAGLTVRALQEDSGLDVSDNVTIDVNDQFLADRFSGRCQSRYKDVGTGDIDACIETAQKHVDVRDLVEAYGCDSVDESRGSALVIANEEFSRESNLDERLRTEIDVENLKNLFSFLNFEVLVEWNLSAEKIIDRCKEERQKLSSKRRIFILCQLSQGKPGFVTGVDGENVNIDQIVKLFDGNSGERLRSEAKFFFIQACQLAQNTKGLPVLVTGSTIDSGFDSLSNRMGDLVLQSDSADYTPWRTRHEHVGYVAQGCVEHRDVTKSSIQFVANELVKFAHEGGFMEIVARVNEVTPLFVKIEELVTLRNARIRKINDLLSQLDNHRVEVRNLSKITNSQQEQNQSTEVDMKELRGCVERVDVHITECNSKFESCQELLHECQTIVSSHSNYPVLPSSSNHTLAVTALKELCWQVTTHMYRTVFLDVYAERRKYSFSDIITKIDRLSDDLKRQEKKSILENLIHKISWNDNMEITIQNLLNGYEYVQVLPQFKLDNSNIEQIFNCDILDTDEESTIRLLIKIWQGLQDCNLGISH